LKFLLPGPDFWPHDPHFGSNQIPINKNEWETQYDASLTNFNLFIYDSITNWNLTHNGHTGNTLIIFLEMHFQVN
jgi:hypothetical protein